jgi:hypothetical protein
MSVGLNPGSVAELALCPGIVVFPSPSSYPATYRVTLRRQACIVARGRTPVILTAAEIIASAAERGGPIDYVATLRALNRHVERVLNPDTLKSRISTLFRERRRPNALDPVHLLKEYAPVHAGSSSPRTRGS